MTKTKSMTLQCLGVFIAFLGVWWWVGREYNKAYPEPIKVYTGRWIEDIRKVGDFWSPGYLEVIK